MNTSTGTTTQIHATSRQSLQQPAPSKTNPSSRPSRHRVKPARNDYVDLDIVLDDDEGPEPSGPARKRRKTSSTKDESFVDHGEVEDPSDDEE